MRTRKPAKIRKAEITRAALELAFEFGPDRVTTVMIADRLKLTQPAIYKHFPKKDDIWRAATENLCERIEQNIQAAISQPDPIARLLGLLKGQLRLLHDHPALPEIMVMREPNSWTTELQSRVLASFGGLRSAIVNSMGEAQSMGHVRCDLDVDECTDLVIGVVQGLALRLLRFREPENLLGAGEHLLGVQLKLLTEQGDFK